MSIECGECGRTFAGESEGHLVPAMQVGAFDFVCNECWSVPSAYEDNDGRFTEVERPAHCPECGEVVTNAFADEDGQDYYTRCECGFYFSFK